MASLPRILDGISEVVHDHSWFVVDQWGVLHDGYTAHPGAIDALRRLREVGPIALVSNTSRRVDTAAAVLTQLGFPPDLYDACFTAGELAARWLETRAEARPGPLRVLSLLGPPHPDSLLHTVPVEIVDTVEQADVVLASGTWRQDRAEFDPILRAALQHALPLLCGNPDVRSIQPDGSFIWCPGAFAERYAHMGGDVHHFGKPRQAIYDAAKATLGVSGGGLAFGDSLEHDARGANLAGLAITFVTRGIHGPELGLHPSQRPTAATVADIAHAHDTNVDYAIAGFRW